MSPRKNTVNIFVTFAEILGFGGLHILFVVSLINININSNNVKLHLFLLFEIIFTVIFLHSIIVFLLRNSLSNKMIKIVLSFSAFILAGICFISLYYKLYTNYAIIYIGLIANTGLYVPILKLYTFNSNKNK